MHPERHKRRNQLKVDLIVLAALTLTVILAIAASGNDRNAPPAHIIGVEHLYVQITVWSDGTVEVPPPTILDARQARRIANRLEDEEDRNRPLRRAVGDLPPRVQRAMAQADALPDADQADTDPGRCHAIAKSTGQRCKNRSGSGRMYCNIHRPHAATN